METNIHSKSVSLHPYKHSEKKKGRKLKKIYKAATNKQIKKRAIKANIRSTRKPKIIIIIMIIFFFKVAP